MDEDLFAQFWADKAFQTNGWGAFCSKVSPNVHVLGLLKVCARGAALFPLPLGRAREVLRECLPGVRMP